MIIRPASKQDQEPVWQILKTVLEAGIYYAFYPDSSREYMLGYWFGKGKQVYVAEENGQILGTYYLCPNQPGFGDHVANGGYAVSPEARGKGVGRLMGEHSILEAPKLGFSAIQYNFVINSNEVAVALWQNLGFSIIGEVPGAFRHPSLGPVSVYVMHRTV